MSAPPSSSGGKVEKLGMNCRPLDLRCKTNARAENLHQCRNTESVRGRMIIFYTLIRAWVAPYLWNEV
uniref:Uncharacterized protein n=1 Tax=Salix viminalis TaxID=40686 RepID=A0A6N2K480_SALVM